MANDNPLYVGGFPNFDRLGFMPLRQSSAQEPYVGEIEKAAGSIRQPVKYVDADGYEREIIAAAVEVGCGKIVYVECRAKELEHGFVDIDFHIHFRDEVGNDQAWSIESYNPYFGCEVGYIKWFEQSVVLIYREKHRTYVCKVAKNDRPVFKKIADDWIINGHILGYQDWQETSVNRLSLPSLDLLEPISEADARAQGILPSIP